MKWEQQRDAKKDLPKQNNSQQSSEGMTFKASSPYSEPKSAHAFSVARVNAATAMFTQRYTFLHRLEDTEEIDLLSATGIADMTYELDAAKYSDLERLIGRNGGRFRKGEVAIGVGFLSIDNAEQSSWPIHLPLHDLNASLARVDSCTKTFEINLERLRWVPLRLQATILDEPQTSDWGANFFEAHEFADHLLLRMRLLVAINPELLRGAQSMLRQLGQFLKRDREINVLRIDSDFEEKTKGLASGMAALANTAGGVLLLGVNTRNEITGASPAKAAILAQKAYEVALSLEPPLPIAPPIRFSINGNDVVIIEVPKTSNRPRHHQGKLFSLSHDGKVVENTPNVSPSNRGDLVKKKDEEEKPGTREHTVLTDDEAEREIMRGVTDKTYFFTGEAERLSFIQAAMANSAGGRIYFSVRSRGSQHPGEILGIAEKDVLPRKQEIVRYSHSRIRLQPPYEVKVDKKFVLVQEVPARLSELFRAEDRRFYGYDGSTFRTLSDSDAMDTLRDRSPTWEPIFTTPKPFLESCSLQWVDFPSQMYLYDPTTGCLEWKHVSMKEVSDKPGYFECYLEAPISRAKELLEKGTLSGQIRIELDNVLFQPMTLHDFDALGNSQTVDWGIRTVLCSDYSLSLPHLLRKRPYYPRRSLSILGVEPSLQRLRDLVRILNDVGVIVRKVEPTSYYSGAFLDGISLFGDKLGGHGVTSIECRVSGKPVVVKRRLQKGQFIDDKELSSGVLNLAFRVETDESHEDVTLLLNDVIENIRRRFRCLNVE